MARQHAGYCDALRRGGLRVIRLPPLPEFPDAPFVEDLGVAFPEVFVLGRSAAPSRRGEAEATAQSVGAVEWRRLLEEEGGGARPRPVVSVPGPETLDGGDVLKAGRHVLVGVSGRTGPGGHAFLQSHLEPLGYRVRAVPVAGALHLKTACTALDPETLLVNPDWVDPSGLGGFRIVEVRPGEAFGANVLPLQGGLLAPASAPGTRNRLADMGYPSLGVDISEFEKAEGGLTCLSLPLR